MTHFTMMINIFTVALIIVFCQVNDAQITNLTQNATSKAPHLEAETAMSDGGNKEASYTSLSIIETYKANRDPIEDDSNNDRLEKASIMATDKPMSDGGATFVRDEITVFENDGIEKASNYNSLPNIEINKVAAPFDDDSKATALLEDDSSNESLKKTTIMVPYEKNFTKLENSKNDGIKKRNITSVDEAKTFIRNAKKKVTKFQKPATLKNKPGTPKPDICKIVVTAAS